MAAQDELDVLRSSRPAKNDKRDRYCQTEIVPTPERYDSRDTEADLNPTEFVFERTWEPPDTWGRYVLRIRVKHAIIYEADSYCVEKYFAPENRRHIRRPSGAPSSVKPDERANERNYKKNDSRVR
jgi:hypothetical protein